MSASARRRRDEETIAATTPSSLCRSGTGIGLPGVGHHIQLPKFTQSRCVPRPPPPLGRFQVRHPFPMAYSKEMSHTTLDVVHYMAELIHTRRYGIVRRTCLPRHSRPGVCSGPPFSRHPPTRARGSCSHPPARRHTCHFREVAPPEPPRGAAAAAPAPVCHKPRPPNPSATAVGSHCTTDAHRRRLRRASLHGHCATLGASAAMRAGGPRPPRTRMYAPRRSPRDPRSTLARPPPARPDGFSGQNFPPPPSPKGWPPISSWRALTGPEELSRRFRSSAHEGGRPWRYQRFDNIVREIPDMSEAAGWAALSEEEEAHGYTKNTRAHVIVRDLDGRGPPRLPSLSTCGSCRTSWSQQRMPRRTPAR